VREDDEGEPGIEKREAAPRLGAGVCRVQYRAIGQVGSVGVGFVSWLRGLEILFWNTVIHHALEETHEKRGGVLSLDAVLERDQYAHEKHTKVVEIFLFFFFFPVFFFLLIFFFLILKKILVTKKKKK
jgi:hypothetical protein